MLLFRIIKTLKFLKSYLKKSENLKRRYRFEIMRKQK